MDRKPILAYLLALAVFAAMSILVIGIERPAEQIYEDGYSHIVQHLHTLFWQGQDAAEGRLFSTEDGYSRFPSGLIAFPVHIVSVTLMLPVIWAAGPIAGSNAAILLDFLFAGMAMFWLVRWRTRDFWAALFAGAIFSLGPTMVQSMQGGVVESLQTGWVALAVGAALALLDDAEKPDGKKRTQKLVLIAGIVWMITSAFNWYFGIFSGIIVAMLIAARLTTHRELTKPVLRRMAAAGGVFALMVAPILWAFISTVAGSGSATFSFDPARLHHADCLDAAYPGRYFDLPILLVFFGLARKTTRRTVAFWLGVAALFFVLAIGPTLFFADNDVLIGGSNVRMPFHFLAKVLPVFATMPHPSRFVVGGNFALCLAIGIGLAGLLKHRTLQAAAFIPLIAWVFLAAQTPVRPVTIAPVGPMAVIENDDGKGTVFDLPADRRNVRRYLYNQLFHKRPIVYDAWNYEPDPLLDREFLVVRALLLDRIRDPHEPQDSPANRPSDPRAVTLAECLAAEPGCAAQQNNIVASELARLREMGLTRFLLHRDRLVPGSRLPAICNRLVGPPVASEDDVELYVLGEF
jgi:hypothetical protein